jgi:hypothetical protein
LQQAQTARTRRVPGDIYGHVSPDVARPAMDMLGEAFDR